MAAPPRIITASMQRRRPTQLLRCMRLYPPPLDENMSLTNGQSRKGLLPATGPVDDNIQFGGVGRCRKNESRIRLREVSSSADGKSRQETPLKTRRNACAHSIGFTVTSPQFDAQIVARSAAVSQDPCG